MKILFTSDWHLDWVTAGFERFNDLKLAVDQTVQLAKAADVDTYIFCGDLCDPNTSRSYRAISLAIATAERLSDAGIRTLWLTGNHDVIEDGYNTSTLSPLAEVAEVVSNPGHRMVGGVEMLFFPFTSRAATYSPEVVLSDSVASGHNIQCVIGHLNIEGITAGSETTDMPRGRDVFFPLDAVRKAYPDALLVNGHYHESQEWQGKGKGQPIHIPGSLAALTFGEEHLTPGVMLVDLKRG